MKHETLEAVERERERVILLEDKKTTLFNSLTHTCISRSKLIYEKIDVKTQMLYVLFCVGNSTKYI